MVINDIVFSNSSLMEESTGSGTTIIDIVFSNSNLIQLITGSGTTINDSVFKISSIYERSTGTPGGYLKGISYDGPNIVVWTGSGVSAIYPVFNGSHIIQVTHVN